MSDVFAEATVKISPSLTGFKTQLEEDLKKIMDKVQVKPVRIKPALSIDFVGDLRKQVNAAIVKAQGGIKPIRVKALIEPVGVAAGRTRVVPGTPGGGGSGGGGGGGGRSGGGSGANTALARSLEQVVVAQRNLNAAFDESLPIKEQINAVTKVTTALDEAQEAAERSLTKAIVAKDAAAKRAATKQLADIEDFRRNIESRVQQVQAQVPVAAPKVDAGTKAAIANTRKLSDSFKTLVADIHKVDAAEEKLGTSTSDLAARKAVLRQRTQQLEAISKLETKAAASSNALVKQAILNAKLRATAAVESAQKQVTAIDSVAKAEAAAAKQSEAAARTQAAARRRQEQAAAKAAASERRRSEQLSRGGQASLLSLAGIRGATLAASRSFLVGAAAITVFAQAVRQFADLERNLHVFEATTAATAEEMEAVRLEARELGADLTLPAVSAGTAAGAMVELAKAGLTVQDSIDGARAVLELATAAAIDTADAVRLVANVLNAFSLTGKEATDVADTLANAANAAQGSIADIGTAFQQAASAGHQVGLSFQDTATFLTILAKNGIRGSDAGTSLRTALIRLVNPSKKAQEAFEKLGITLRDARGNLRPDVFLQIADATAKLGPAQRDATIALIGGQDAFRAVTILGRQTVDSFLAMRAALRVEGTAAELAKARTEGLHGAIDGLQSVLETVGTDLARNVGPGLSSFVRGISESITALSQSSEVAGVLQTKLDSLRITFDLLGTAINAALTVAIPFAKLAADLTTAIGAPALLSGFLAFRTLNALLDGAILRIRALKPLFAIIATAKISSSLSTGFTAASLALERFNKAKTGTIAGEGITGFARLVQVEKELAVTMAATATRASAFKSALRGIASAALIAATSTTALAIGLAAAGAAIVLMVTRESSLERATRRVREETEALARAFDRVEESGREVVDANRAVAQQLNAIEQAQINLLNARAVAQQSDAGSETREGRQILLNLKVATQDLGFATQEYKRSLDDLEAAQAKQRAAEANQTRERKDARKVVQDLIDSELRLIRGLAPGGPSDTRTGIETVRRQELIRTLREQALVESRSENVTETQIASRKRLVALIIEQSKIPLEDLAPKLGEIFSAQNLEGALRNAAVFFNKSGKKAIDAFVKAVRDGIANKKTLAGAIRDALAQGDDVADEKGKDWSHKVSDGFVFGTTKWKDEIGRPAAVALGGALELALAEVKGFSLQAQLVIAQGTLTSATNLRERLERNFNRNRGTKPTAVAENQKKALAAATAAEQAAQDDVDRIQGDITRTQEETAQKLVDAQTERDKNAQKITDAITEGRRATLLQRRITTAGLTEWLGDDLKTTQAWLNFLIGQKKTLVARLKAVGASKAFITAAMKAISDLIFDVKNSVASITKDIANNAKEASDILNSVAFQKIDIRIRIAQAQENTAAELALRRKRLEMITRELVRIKRTVGKNTVAWLELKLAQAEEIAAIKELEKTQRDRNKANAELAFAFLQTQQGFAATLLGNLLPIGAIGGTVAGNLAAGGAGGGGGASGSSAGGFQLPREQASGLTFPNPNFRGGGGGKIAVGLATAGADGAVAGPTRGQQTVELDLLRQILRAIQALSKNTKHPENKQQNKLTNSKMETHK